MNEAEFPELKAIADEIVDNPGLLTSVVERFLGGLPFRTRLGRQCAVAVILLERREQAAGTDVLRHLAAEAPTLPPEQLIALHVDVAQALAYLGGARGDGQAVLELVAAVAAAGEKVFPEEQRPYVLGFMNALVEHLLPY